MRIALAQLNPLSGDVDGNARALIRAMDEARARGAEMLVAPEMVVPGYCIGDLVEDAASSPRTSGPSRGSRRRRAASPRSSASSTAISGATTITARRKYNAAAVVRDGQVLQRAHKTLLPNYRYFDDKRYFAPAERRQPVDAGPGGPRPRRRVHLRGHVGRLL